MLIAALHESAIGPKRTSLAAPHMSAFGGKADMPIARKMSAYDAVDGASSPATRATHCLNALARPAASLPP
jgi:hypothetical protein